MLITFFAEDVLRQAWRPEQSHLLRIKQAKVHRFTNVAVRFRPRLSNLEDLERGKFVTAFAHEGSGTLEHSRALLEWSGAPFPKRGAGGPDHAFRFWNSRLGDVADNFLRYAGIDRCDRFPRAHPFAVNDERIFFAELSAHLRQRGPHFFLVFVMDEIHQGGVFVSVSRRRLDSSAI